MNEETEAAVNDVLAHYGILGMRWGVRNDKKGRGADSESYKKRAKARAGARSYDSRKLSNRELKKVVERIKLEQEYANLNKKSVNDGKSFTQEALKKLPAMAITTAFTFVVKEALKSGKDRAVKNTTEKVVSKGATSLAKSLAL